ncbi:hypothetical protein Tco_0342993, partial [Tanacetum coccineum]
RADAQLCVGTGRSDDGMDQAGSGVADECTCLSGTESSSMFRSSGVEETDGLSLVSMVVQAVYLADGVVFEELGAAIETIQKSLEQQLKSLCQWSSKPYTQLTELSLTELSF